MSLKNHLKTVNYSNQKISFEFESGNSNIVKLSEHASTHQKGFSLMEVLASLVMITFGLLSLTSLQTRSVKLSTVAYTETQAALHLEEAVELLRANKIAASNGDYNFSLDSVDSFSPGGSTIAEIDRYRWLYNLNSTLPGAKASIDCDNASQCVLELQYEFLGISKSQTLAVIL